MGGPVVQLGMCPFDDAEHHCRAIGIAAAAAGRQLGEHETARAGECAAHVVSTVHALTPGAP
jgi:hypothetical protein